MSSPNGTNIQQIQRETLLAIITNSDLRYGLELTSIKVALTMLDGSAWIRVNLKILSVTWVLMALR